MKTMDGDRLRAVWETELERLELDVISIERLIRGLDSAPMEPWSPPAVLGSMPVDLAARAQELLARQRVASQALTTALEQARKQVAYAGRVIDITGRMPADPVYFDVEA
ncbi:MAG TPA: hypothetical protein VFE15_00110 [Marmoricola sp.]|jgi:hypothetical protein|nr:hypothetical protein [Marmoricola sp.]